MKKRKLLDVKPGTFFLYRRCLYLRINPNEDWYIPWAVKVTDGSDNGFYPPCQDFDSEREVTPIKMNLIRR